MKLNLKKENIVIIIAVLIVIVGAVFYGFYGKPAVVNKNQTAVLAGQTYTNEKGEKWGPLPQGKADFQVTSADDIFPKFVSATIDPLDVHVGDTQKMKVVVQDDVDVASVIAEIETDNGTTTARLKRTGQQAVTEEDFLNQKYFVKDGVLNILNESNRQFAIPEDLKPILAKKVTRANLLPTAQAQGEVLQKYTYEGEWLVKDTHVRKYHTVFIASDVLGRKNQLVMAWSDPCNLPTIGTGNQILSEPCALGTNETDGWDGGNLTIDSGINLTLNSGSVFGWNPAKSITVNGSISVSGGQLKQGYTYYRDIDGDSRAPDSTRTWDSASTKSSYVRRSSAVAVTDCADNNASVWWNGYGLDSDRDGWGQSTYGCYNGSANYDATAGTDCLDTDIAKQKSRYADLDSDGYVYGFASLFCVGATQTGYVDSFTPGQWQDCNDSNPNIQLGGDFYDDSDQDGYSDGSLYPVQCVGLPIQVVGGRDYYKNSSGVYAWMGNYYGVFPQLGTFDCNDNDPNAWRNRYADSDGDTYGAGSLVCVGNQGGYVDNNSDCNDGYACVYNSVGSLITDSDQDGRTVGSAAAQCVGGTQPAGGRTYYRGTGCNYPWLVSSQGLGSDCGDSNPNAWTYGYGLDSDRDTYGQSSYGCYNGSANYDATAGTDCYDSNVNAKPGQTTYFDTNRGDGSFDYNCDTYTSPYYSVGGSCSDPTNYCYNPDYDRYDTWPCDFACPGTGSSGFEYDPGCGGSATYVTESGAPCGPACSTGYYTQSCR